MANYHVTKRQGEDFWRSTKENAQRSSAKTNTQAEAEALSKQFAKNSGGGEVRIHRPSGQIRDSDTVAPGNESPVRDKKH